MNCASPWSLSTTSLTIKTCLISTLVQTFTGVCDPECLKNNIVRLPERTTWRYVSSEILKAFS